MRVDIAAAAFHRISVHPVPDAVKRPVDER